MLSQKQVDQFKLLYKKHFEASISDKEAIKKGTQLVSLLKLSLINNEYDDESKSKK